MPIPNKAARFPPLNTLRFIPANKDLPENYNTWQFDRGFFYQHIKKYFQQKVFYPQKVQKKDVITIYFDCLAAGGVDIVILDEYSNTVATVVSGLTYTHSALGNNDAYFNSQYYTYIYQFVVEDILTDDGFYWVAVQATYAADPEPLNDTIFISECIALKNEGWDKTMLFEYSNDDNDYDVIWFASGTPRPWGFRVEAYIDIEPGGKEVAFEDMFYMVEKLQSIPYRVGELTVGGEGGVPPWVLDKVNRILACDTFRIEGTVWEKEVNANWSVKKAENNPMKAGTIKLRDNPEVSEWEFNNSDDDRTFRIHDDTYDDTHD